MIAKAVEPKIEISLSDPGMTMLHRAGVAGLYMTLKALAKRYPTQKSRRSNFQWTLTKTSISLYWKGNDYEALDWLFSESFQISSNGLISLTGLQSPSRESQLAIHVGITNTFLQHNQFFKTAGDATENLTINGLEIAIDYKKAKSYAHQNYAEQLCPIEKLNFKRIFTKLRLFIFIHYTLIGLLFLFDIIQGGNIQQKTIGITGWLYPGATVKHYAYKKETQFTETRERAIALLYAPVACLYFITPKSHLNDTKTQYCLVIPAITDLELYARQRQKMNNWDYQQFLASGYSDAGFRLLTQQATVRIIQQNHLKRCQVITFGQTQWTGFQKIRKNVEIVEITDKVNENYQLCDRYFNNRVVEWEEGNFVAASIIRELISENLARGFPWWHNFTHAFRSSDLFKLVSYEKQGLQAMVKNAQWDEQAQKLFVKACHQALLQIYGKLYGRAKEGEYTQIERENERIRSGLIRCQNSEDFRHFMTANFWSKAGNISILADYWEELMPLTTKPDNWKLARDLALLALASYKPKARQQVESFLDLEFDNVPIKFWITFIALFDVNFLAAILFLPKSPNSKPASEDE
ncbi:MAG: type I-MYXAN CRISPR-associated Cas8a1/Cmx1 [Xenococcaceae cyanobacterium MO_188.B29]|nr:type I-MYXAN CRISPR-associated Cas8a1/Cmx1 [Xenococcaceae cyanobacterium MO_188.B29]